MKPTTREALLKAIGRRIAELRRARGLTQEALAEKIEVTPRYLQSVEGGHENLTVGSLVDLANALRVHVAALFEPPAETSPARGRPPKGSRG